MSAPEGISLGTTRVSPSPPTPADAFERFVAIMRASSPVHLATTETELFSLIRPFLVNPDRHWPHVGLIITAGIWARVLQSMGVTRPLYWFMRAASPFSKSARLLAHAFEATSPKLIDTLLVMAKSLSAELIPGSLHLHLKPTRYLDTPAGYRNPVFHRYRIQAQLAVEPTTGDTLEAVDVQLTLDAGAVEATIDAISPQPGFSAVGVRRSAGAQVGEKESAGLKSNIESEVSVGALKSKTAAEASNSVERSTLLSLNSEMTVARVEQYLVARVAGERVYWRALAGVGPIDAGGLEYTADVLLPDSVSEVGVTLKAGVDWRRAGRIPAELVRSIALPRPGHDRPRSHPE